MLKQLFENLSIRKTSIYFFLLITFTTITYSNHFNNSFHFDDSHTIQNNLFIQNIKNIPLFFKDGTTISSLPSNQAYRPIVTTSLAIDYWLGNGYNVFYFHLSSFILFLLQGILMFFIIYRLLEGSFKNNWNFYIAAIAVAWYLMHPANAETVNYIIARSDIQSTFFVVLGFVLYIFSPFCKKTFLYLIPVGIGVLAKPSAVMFAPILFFYILFFEQNIGLSEVFRKEHFRQFVTAVKRFLPAFIFCIIMYKVVDHLTPKTWMSGGSSTFNYLITQPYVILHYFNTFFLPLGLSADTDWQTLDSIRDSKFFIGCAFILFMIVIAYWFSKEKQLRPISFGIIWFFLALIPTSSVIPFSEVMNDHRLYFPFVGLVISVCWVLALIAIKQKKRLGNNTGRFDVMLLFVVLLSLSGYAYGTRQRNKVWNTEESLWYDVTIKSPNNARGLMNYGLSKMAKGDYQEAEKYFTKALSMWPDYSFLSVNMGILKSATGDKECAETYFKHAIAVGGGYPDTWYFYGNFLYDQARYSEAVTHLLKCIEISPAHIGARSLLMKTYNETGDWEKLTELAQSTIKIIPGNPEAERFLEAGKNKKGKIEIAEEEIKKAPGPEKYLNLSVLYYQAGKYEYAINAALEAIKLQPDYPEAYNNIGSAYNQLKQYDKAIEACQKAIALNPDFQLAKNNLADATRNRDQTSQSEKVAREKPTAGNYLNLSLTYYNQGQFEKAVDACKKALQLNPYYADAYSNLGVAYIQLKQFDKAIDACSMALKINPQHKLATGNLNWAKAEKEKSKNNQ